MGRVMKRFVLMVVVPAVALLGGGYIYLKSGRYVETDNAYVKADKVQVSTDVEDLDACEFFLLHLHSRR